jgi:predicted Rossmann fold flavoprotein
VWIDGTVAERLRGSLLWTHFGISGPVALNASRHWARAHLEGRPVALTLNCCPGESFDAVDRRLMRLATERPRALILTGLSAFLPAAVASTILGRLSIPSEETLAHMTRDGRRRLVHALTGWPLAVSGTRGYTVAEATAGGVALDEIDPATMESRVCPGLYLVGEILDVDGRIGGFNFQWAWSSARAAARSLSRRQPLAARP